MMSSPVRKFQTGYRLDKHGVTQGLLGDFIDCRERARLRLDGVQAVGNRMPLMFGDCGHQALEYIYNHYAIKKMPSKDATLQRQIDKLVDEVVSRWGHAVLASTSEPQVAQDVEYISHMVPALMREYVVHYRDDFTKLKMLGLEAEFANPFNGCTLRGKRDGVYKERNSLWVLEHKFKGRIRHNVLDSSLTFDWQNLFYLINTKIETGKRMGGVLYNIIRMPQLKQGKNEGWETFARRVVDDIKERPDWYFVRYPLTYPAEVVEDAAMELRYKVEEFKAWLTGDLPTYRNQAACVQPWGNCQYLDACGQGDTSGYIIRKRIYPELDDDNIPG